MSQKSSFLWVSYFSTVSVSKVKLKYFSILEKSLKALLGATSSSPGNDALDEIPSRSERLYRISTGNSLNEKLAARVSNEKSEIYKEKDSLGFFINTIKSLFNKSRSTVMTLSMLALLLGYSIKGEFPVLIIVFILMLLAYNIHNEIRINENEGNLKTKEEELKEKFINKFIDEAVVELNHKERMSKLFFSEVKIFNDKIKKLFDIHKVNLEKPVDKHDDEGGLNMGFIEYSTLKDILWAECQEILKEIKKQRSEECENLVNKLIKEKEDKLLGVDAKFSKSLNDLKSKRLESLKEAPKDETSEVRRQKIYEEYHSASRIIRDENRLRKLEAKKSSHKDVISAKDELRVKVNEINRKIPHIRLKIRSDFVDLVLDDEAKGIRIDELDVFLKRINDELKRMIEAVLNPPSSVNISSTDTSIASSVTISKEVVKTTNPQEKPSVSKKDATVYIDHLESHNVALVGSEADAYLASSNRDAKPPKSAIESSLIATIRHQYDPQHSLIPASNGVTLITNEPEIPCISLSAEGCSQSTRINELKAESSQDEELYQWSANLSDYSYEQALLDQGTISIKLTFLDNDIDLFNAPYLLSNASLTYTQRRQLFSHLNIYLLVRVHKKTGMVQIDLLGDEGRETHFSFVGCYSQEYEETMLEQWYQNIAHTICINEPFEVSKNYA